MSDPSGDLFSWTGYERAWKSDAIWVDLRPVSEHVKRIQDKRPGRTDKARAYNTVGECAAAILFGGAVQTLDKSKPDLELRSGEHYEVRTSFWGGSKKYAPSMTSAKRGPAAGRQKSLPTVWCVTKRYPDCYDGVWVCGIMQPLAFRKTRVAGTGKFGWAWLNKWVDDGRFSHVAEVMQDELRHPALPVGMTYRRDDGDLGLVEYLESYGFLREVKASASTPIASISKIPGSGTGSGTAQSG